MRLASVAAPTSHHRQHYGSPPLLLALLTLLSYLPGLAIPAAHAQSAPERPQAGAPSEVRPEAQSEVPGGEAGERTFADEVIPVEVKDMVVTRAGVALTLVSDETQQELHLMIGTVEGQAIVRALRHVKVPRPQTHDLMKTLLERDGWQVTRVIIRELIDDTYYADIVMQKPGEFGIPGNVEERTIDARPSDAMALGLRFDATIYVRQKVFDEERKHREQQEPINKQDQADTLTI